MRAQTGAVVTGVVSAPILRGNGSDNRAKGAALLKGVILAAALCGVAATTLAASTAPDWKSDQTTSESSSLDQIPFNATIPFSLDLRQIHFPVYKGETTQQVLTRACRDWNMCPQRTQGIVRATIRAYFTVGNNLAYFLMIQCGATGSSAYAGELGPGHGDVQDQEGWGKSKVRSFLTPLLLPLETVNTPTKEILFPLQPNDWADSRRLRRSISIDSAQ